MRREALESLTGIDIPTREEMQEIEASSRLYEENDALYMTALVVWRADTHQPANTPVTSSSTPRHLITVRYADPLPFKNFLVRCPSSRARSARATPPSSVFSKRSSTAAPIS